MTGENFMRIDRGSDIKRIKENIVSLRNRCGELLNVNTINEKGFNEEEYYKLCRKIERQERLLWGWTEK